MQNMQKLLEHAVIGGRYGTSKRSARERLHMPHMQEKLLGIQNRRGQHGKFTKIPLCSWKCLREYDKLKEVNKGKLSINKYANSEDYQEETICDRIKESLEIAGADGLTPREIREVIFLCCGKVYSLPTLYRRLEVLSDCEEIMAVGSRNKSRIWKLRGAGD